MITLLLENLSIAKIMEARSQMELFSKLLMIYSIFYRSISNTEFKRAWKDYKHIVII